MGAEECAFKATGTTFWLAQEKTSFYTCKGRIQSRRGVAGNQTVMLDAPMRQHNLFSPVNTYHPNNLAHPGIRGAYDLPFQALGKRR